ncbi:hypothetical protein HDU96_010402 [Phlyctochytrium bullatum]|nr:hypothetical protein HDU96_010402 [Phlyctochytrium bullatum]
MTGTGAKEAAAAPADSSKPFKSSSGATNDPPAATPNNPTETHSSASQEATRDLLRDTQPAKRRSGRLNHQASSNGSGGSAPPTTSTRGPKKKETKEKSGPVKVTEQHAKRFGLVSEECTLDDFPEESEQSIDTMSARIPRPDEKGPDGLPLLPIGPPVRPKWYGTPESDPKTIAAEVKAELSGFTSSDSSTESSTTTSSSDDSSESESISSEKATFSAPTEPPPAPLSKAATIALSRPTEFKHLPDPLRRERERERKGKAMSQTAPALLGVEGSPPPLPLSSKSATTASSKSTESVDLLTLLRRERERKNNGAPTPFDGEGTSRDDAAPTEPPPATLSKSDTAASSKSTESVDQVVDLPTPVRRGRKSKGKSETAPKLVNADGTSRDESKLPPAERRNSKVRMSGTTTPPSEGGTGKGAASPAANTGGQYRPRVWTDVMVETFFKLRFEKLREHFPEDSRSAAGQWDLLAEVVAKEHGVVLTGSQAAHKFSNMRQAYDRWRDRLAKGHRVQLPTYWALMEKHFGDKDDVAPKTTSAPAGEGEGGSVPAASPGKKPLPKRKARPEDEDGRPRLREISSDDDLEIDEEPYEPPKLKRKDPPGGDDAPTGPPPKRPSTTNSTPVLGAASTVRPVSAPTAATSMRYVPPANATPAPLGSRTPATAILALLQRARTIAVRSGSAVGTSRRDSIAKKDSGKGKLDLVASAAVDMDKMEIDSAQLVKEANGAGAKENGSTASGGSTSAAPAPTSKPTSTLQPSVSSASSVSVIPATPATADGDAVSTSVSQSISRRLDGDARFARLAALQAEMVVMARMTVDRRREELREAERELERQQLLLRKMEAWDLMTDGVFDLV